MRRNGEEPVNQRFVSAQKRQTGMICWIQRRKQEVRITEPKFLTQTTNMVVNRRDGLETGAEEDKLNFEVGTRFLGDI